MIETNSTTFIWQVSMVGVPLKLKGVVETNLLKVN